MNDVDKAVLFEKNYNKIWFAIQFKHQTSFLGFAGDPETNLSHTATYTHAACQSLSNTIKTSQIFIRT